MEVGFYTQRIFIDQRQKEDIQTISKFIDDVSLLLSNTSPIEEHDYLFEESDMQLKYFICSTFSACVFVWLQINLFVFYLTSFTKELPVNEINNLVINHFNTDKFEYSARVMKEIK